MIFTRQQIDDYLTQELIDSTNNELRQEISKVLVLRVNIKRSAGLGEILNYYKLRFNHHLKMRKCKKLGKMLQSFIDYAVDTNSAVDDQGKRVAQADLQEQRQQNQAIYRNIVNGL